MATLAQLRTEVLAYGFDTTVYSSRITNWLNEAQGRVSRMVDVPALHSTGSISTVAGTAAYSLASTFLRMDRVYYTDMEWVIYPMDPGDLRATQYPTNQTGRPEQYAIVQSGTDLQFTPIPDGVYSVQYEYWRRPATLTNDSDTPEIPSDYHDILVSYALSKCYRSEDDAQMSQFYMAEFQRDVRTYGNDLRGATAVDGPKVLPGTWGDFT